MTGQRLLVCGGRNYADSERVDRVLSGFHNNHGIEILIHGAAKGADTLAASWAARNSVPTKSFPADWLTHGRAAGPIRNQRMLDEGQPNWVIAFPGGRGTANMIELAKANPNTTVVIMKEGTSQ